MADINGSIDSVFPVGSLVPKVETGVLNFQKKYPEYDGRDVTIAIFDSGVDPRASGLQHLCDGKSVKVIERFDCSGCGDTDLSKKVTANGKGCITGLSGRQLKLTPEMVSANTANGEYRIGLKSMFDLTPSKVRETITNHNKSKEWDQAHKMAVGSATRKISEFEVQNPEATKLTWEKKLVKEDLDQYTTFLETYDRIYGDVKTAYDCILYPTENGWQAVIDTTEKGDLENALHIGEYTKTYEVKNIDDYFSISINVHDEGNVLEIVGMCSSHGTHVAAIASANHSSKDIDGVAPNAKIVSCSIGDGRLGSMETGTGLVRAMMKVIEMCKSGRPVDIINMSYGEHAAWSNVGRIGELMSEVVNKYGVVWIVSAGNHGPALCTVGTPPDISQPCCIGVGAYVSPQMMEAEYALREKLPANVYTWTSRDPCIDGGQGVSVCAPGAAITSVPEFTMSKAQLMNGTSMSAPHVAGAVALLISGLKQKAIRYSPYSIKRAICVTATKVNYIDPFAQGNGLLNVEKAFEHLLQFEQAPENTLRFSIKCGPKNTKGIHIRSGEKNKTEWSIAVEPIFCNEKEVDPKEKINFNVQLNLISSRPFVQCGAFLDLCYTSRTFSVKVDPSGLQPGVHTAVIQAFDCKSIQKGSLFEIPVTVVVPHFLNGDEEETRIFEAPVIEFEANTIQRDFIMVPNKATWAVLQMRSTDKGRSKDIGKFFIHAMQILPMASCRKLECMKILTVKSDNETTLAFKCQQNNILELCIAKYWSNFGSSHIKYSLEFHGIQAINPNAHVMNAARGIHKMEISAFISEEIQPSIQLKTATIVLKPIDTKISALSPTRDVIPDGRQIYQNLLTYNLQICKAQEISLHAPIFNSLLYESEFESQLWMLFDSNKAYICSGDAHSHTFSRKLEKGEYTIKLQIRHEKKEFLEKISEATMLAQFKLPNAITLDVYDHYNQCIVAGKKFTNGFARSTTPKCLFVGPVPNEKITKASIPSGTAWLGGTLILAKDENGRRVDINDFQYILIENSSSAGANKKSGNNNNNNGNMANNNGNTSSAAVSPPNNSGSVGGDGGGGPGGNGKNANNNNNACGDGGGNSVPAAGSSPRKGKSSLEEYSEALRDFQCSMIVKCNTDQAQKIFDEIKIKHPNHGAAYSNLMQNLDSTELLKSQLLPLSFVKYVKPVDSDEKIDVEKMTEIYRRIIKLADTVITETDKDSLLSYYGMKNDPRPDAIKIKSTMDKRKNVLLEALSKKGIAIAKLSIIENSKTKPFEEIDDIFGEIARFVDASDQKVIHFSLWHACIHEHYGRMHKYIQKLMDDKRSRDIFDELIQLSEAMKYEHIQKLLQRFRISNFVSTYRLF